MTERRGMHELTEKIRNGGLLPSTLDEIITSYLRGKAEELKLGMKERCVPYVESILGLEPGGVAVNNTDTVPAYSDADRPEKRKPKVEAPVGREWCEHWKLMTLDHGVKQYPHYLSSISEAWTYKGAFLCGKSPNFCEECGAPRPQEQRKLWETMAIAYWTGQGLQNPTIAHGAWKPVAEAAIVAVEKAIDSAITNRNFCGFEGWHPDLKNKVRDAIKREIRKLL